ncbi:Hypothetical_protein [Hexamita inflata]|uniref:Hypothetical_protein n=1 Tax=Hexamita inflata TaxID=28002 RepID=A0ABP1GJX5_9EUKA
MKQSEKQIRFQLSLKQFVQTAVPIIQSIKYMYSGSQQEIKLNELIQMINSLNQAEAKEFWSTMQQIYKCEYEQLYEFYSNIELQIESFITQGPSNEIIQNDEYNHLVKNTTTKVLKTKQMLRAALIQVSREFEKEVNESISDKDLCNIVDECVDNDSLQQFWNKVTHLVPSKSKKQIYDFYRTSFSKAKFDQYFTKEDKKLIAEMNQSNPDIKPAALAQMFLESTKRNLLKHNVVMQFVNIRRYNSKLSSESSQ